MKDSKGHGSNGRGGTQAAFAMRAQMAAHQSGVAKLGGLVRSFAKDTTAGGEGIPHSGKVMSVPDAYHVAHNSAHQWADVVHHAAQHAQHFFGCMAGMMAATALVKFVFGV